MAASRSNEPWTAVERDQLRRHRQAGLTWRQIGASLGRGPEAVRKEWARIRVESGCVARPDRRSRRYLVVLVVTGLTCFGLGLLSALSFGG